MATGIIRYPNREAHLARGRELFGEDMKTWRFVCPVCGHVATVQDWLDAKAEGSIAFSCIGRFLPGKPREAFSEGNGPCNYAGGGLFALNPVRFDDDPDGNGFFDFAPVSSEEAA